VRLAFMVGGIVSLAAIVIAFFVRKPPVPEVAEGELVESGEVPAPAH
jgi:hypothetical protein